MGGLDYAKNLEELKKLKVGAVLTLLSKYQSSDINYKNDEIKYHLKIDIDDSPTENIK